MGLLKSAKMAHLGSFLIFLIFKTRKKISISKSHNGKVQFFFKKLTNVSFMYVCVAENTELLVFFTFFCTFPIENSLSEGRF